MMMRVLTECVIDIPNPDIANDVKTRIAREHQDRLCEVFQSITGYQPLQAPGRVGINVGTEAVTWNEAEKDWIGSDDDEDDDE